MRARLAAAHIEATPNRVRGLFAMAVAHRYVPYGAEVPGWLRFDQLRRQRTLACDGYMYLAGDIYRRVGGRLAKLRYVGWDHGAVGNHAQMWVGDLLLDPTVGLAAHVSLHDLTHGHAPRSLVDLSYRDVDSSTGATPPHVAGPGSFHDRVARAVLSAAYKPTDIIYMFRVLGDVKTRPVAGARAPGDRGAH